ncbi:uncharacterized protein [Antedon mediterranea]|uniref:uncharacterized protein n=1 Tax=Antedon mediterranea TaxID=105859 RepID=UPI003AF987B6
MDDIDIHNIKYLQVLIPKLDDSNIESTRQDYGNFNEDLIDSMMSGLLEDDSSMELPPSMTGKKHTLNKNVAKKKTVKKQDCSLQHSKESGHNALNKTTKMLNKCLTCGQRFKDKETMSFHCAARGHTNPNDTNVTSIDKKKTNSKQQNVSLKCGECSRKFKDIEALNFHYAMSGHAMSGHEMSGQAMSGHAMSGHDNDCTSDSQEENNTPATTNIKLPCGSCNKKFKDSKSLDLHLALSGHSDNRESNELQKPEKIQKRLSEKKDAEKTQKGHSGKKDSEKKQSEKQKSEMNGKRRSSNNSDCKSKNTFENRNESFNCNGCRKKFKSLKELDMHCALSGHTRAETTEINKATKTTKNNKTDSQKAKILKNGSSLNERKPSTKSSYNCFECGKKFKTLEMLNYHEALSGHATKEENDSNKDEVSDVDDDEEVDDEEVDEEEEVDEGDYSHSEELSDDEQVLTLNEDIVDILCSVCTRKFKNKNALYYHMAISGHGASKLGSDRAVKVKPRSRIADLTSSDSSSSEESESDISDESEEEKPTKNNKAQTKSITKPKCATCKKQFKDTTTLEFHIAMSGHSDNTNIKSKGRPAKDRTSKSTNKRKTSTSQNAKKARGSRQKAVQEEIESEDDDSAEKEKKRQCKECGRKCKDLHAYQYHCAMTGHGSTAVISIAKMDLPATKIQSEDTSDDESLDIKRPRKRQRRKKHSSDDDSDYDEAASRVRSYQSFMEEASVWDKWNPKKGIPCRRCGLLFKRTDELKRHLLTTSHKTNVQE